MTTSPLTIYLNDHLALITGEAELLQRVYDENSESGLAASIVPFIEAVLRQSDRLRDGIKAQGGEPSTVKRAAAWLGEKLGRFKLNDGLLEYTDLARVIELETLMSLAFARRTMWRTLSELEIERLGLTPEELSTFEQQSRAQLESLQDLQQRAATAALRQTASST